MYIYTYLFAPVQTLRGETMLQLFLLSCLCLLCGLFVSRLGDSSKSVPLALLGFTALIVGFTGVMVSLGYIAI